MIFQPLFLRKFFFFKALLLSICFIMFLPASAQACGGLFTSTNQAKISQDTERLLISIGTQKTTLYEQIRYQGNAHDFAWVLPVATVPTVNTASPALFNELETYTAPRFIQPEIHNCDSADIMKSLFSNGTSANAPVTTGGSRVDIYAGGSVGPFTYQVIRSGDAQALTSWLQSHQYTVPINTQDLIRPYVQNYMYFLAMRLRTQGTVANIAPVQITFPTVMKQVTIPIRLAATDIKQQMRMEVSILAQQRFGPQNYREVEVHPDNISNLDPDPVMKYHQLVDSAIQQVGGYGVVTEYAQSISPYALGRYLSDQPAPNSYITRFYTSYTPQLMQRDPVFVPRPDLPNVNTTIKLKDMSGPPDCTAVYLEDAACLTAFPIIPCMVLLAGGIWFWRRRKVRKKNE
ncbi:DUF2330 domain-containing protein [Dictyobacter formicarum]|uniref:DUF2330 domain-containing protein n=1 Tax=Dictyobacter formicarum TaxID=2778368 RepID=A0ABQ3VNU3_9CHLR|nr:DUF2330 domain-containing protein [Dictyobacter formicarum]GHO87478.1 hypothetical protein KSZ_54840 [Dictyobacter formicarum]